MYSIALTVDDNHTRLRLTLSRKRQECSQSFAIVPVSRMTFSRDIHFRSKNQFYCRLWKFYAIYRDVKVSQTRVILFKRLKLSFKTSLYVTADKVTEKIEIPDNNHLNRSPTYNKRRHQSQHQNRQVTDFTLVRGLSHWMAKCVDWFWNCADLVQETWIAINDNGEGNQECDDKYWNLVLRRRDLADFQLVRNSLFDTFEKLDIYSDWIVRQHILLADDPLAGRNREVLLRKTSLMFHLYSSAVRKFHRRTYPTTTRHSFDQLIVYSDHLLTRGLNKYRL